MTLAEDCTTYLTANTLKLARRKAASYGAAVQLPAKGLDCYAKSRESRRQYGLSPRCLDGRCDVGWNSGSEATY
jgi:hypothetical protein